MNLEMNGKESIKDFKTFIEKAKELTESTKKSPQKLTKTSAKKVVSDYEKYKKKQYLDLVKKSKTAIINLIKYLKKINVPEFVIVEYVLMPEDVSLNETKDLLKSYELIIKGLEELVLNPPEDD